MGNGPCRSDTSSDEIAERLVINPTTAKTHLGRTMLELGAHGRARLVVIAYQSGLVAPVLK